MMKLKIGPVGVLETKWILVDNCTACENNWKSQQLESAKQQNAKLAMQKSQVNKD